MLSVGRMTSGAGYEYLTKEVATSHHDYYAGHGEASGRWWGNGLDSLGLAGVVDAGQMEALYGRAIDPTTAEPLGRRFPTFRDADQRLADTIEQWTSRHGREPHGDDLVKLRAQIANTPVRERQAVAALDLTFSPVKSVSALWAIAGDGTRAQIQAAHDRAVTAGLTHLQGVAGASRAGTNGIRTIDTDGWIVAKFTHRMSRTQDPQLHTHSAVLNRVHCTDGKWRTLDSRGIYRSAAGAGGIYTRVLEDELQQRLGVRWVDATDPEGPTPRREIAGVPEQLIKQWSTRRRQIEAALEDLDQTPTGAAATARAAQAAALRTRPSKGKADATPHERWRDEAAAAGFHPDDILTDAAPGPAGTPESSVAAGLDVDEVLDRAVTRLEATTATWRRANLTRAVAEALPAGARSSNDSVQLVEALTNKLQESPRLVCLDAPTPIELPPELTRADGTSIYKPVASTQWTSPAILAAEARLLDTAQQRTPALSLLPSTIEAVLRDGRYSEDQAAAVRAIGRSGRQLELLIGPAGTGKPPHFAPS